MDDTWEDTARLRDADTQAPWATRPNLGAPALVDLLDRTGQPVAHGLRPAAAEQIALLVNDRHQLLIELASSRAVEAAVRRLMESHVAARQEADRRLEQVAAITYASTDGTEYEHEPGCQGQPDCPACWVADIRNALRLPA